MNKFFSIFLLMVVFINVQVFALTPKDNFYVNDYVGVLTDEQIDNMIERANLLNAENGVQVVVVIVPNVIGKDIDSYATTVFNDFQIGSATDDNGVLLLVAVDDGEVTILPGDGFRGYMSASKAGNILDSIFMEKALGGNIDEAVYATFLELVNVGSDMTTGGGSSDNSKNKYNSSGSTTTHKNNRSQDNIIYYFFIIIFLIILVILISKGSAASKTYRKPKPYYRRSTPRININTPRININTHTPKKRPPSSGLGSFGGGGKSSGGGTSRSFTSSKSSFSRPSSSSRPSSRGGGGRSSGGGTSRKF